MNNQTININKAQQQLANSLNKIAHYHVQKYARTLAKGIVPTTAQTQQTATAVNAAELAGGIQGNPQTATDANNAARKAAANKAAANAKKAEENKAAANKAAANARNKAAANNAAANSAASPPTNPSNNSRNGTPP